MDIQKIMRLDIGNFKLSKNVIKRPEKRRDQRAASSEKTLVFFETMLTKYKQLPNDQSFSRVLDALRYLDRSQDAKELFGFIKKYTDNTLKNQVVGPWSHSAMLEIIRKQIKKTDGEKKQRLFEEAETLWSQCPIKDAYIISNMMGIYSAVGKYEEVKQLFDKNKEDADAVMYGEYINTLINTNELVKAGEVLDAATKKFECTKLRTAFTLIITAYFEDKKDQSRAIEWFEKGVNVGMYKNNQLQVDANLIRLNFHFDKDSRKVEGGLSLPLAKVAFLSLLKQLAEQPVHYPAQVITGGHSAGQTKLKDEFPKHLKVEYGINVDWDPNTRILQFTIPHQSVQKAKLAEELFAYVDRNPGITEEQLRAETNTLERQYQADLRHANEGRPFKLASKAPVIPEEYSAESKQLAGQALNCFRVGNNAAAIKTYRELIQKEPDHPWAYVELGWVLQRNNKLDEAIAQYQLAIEKCDRKEKYHSICSEAHRKIGWASYRKNLLDQAQKHYQLALELDPDNAEIHNNWGMLYEKRKEYDKAITEFKKLIDKNPHHAEAYVHIGDCYKHKDDYKNAHESYQIAIKRYGENGDGRSASWAYAQLGVLYLLQYKRAQVITDFFEKAKTAFEKSLELHPDRKEALEGLRDLHTLGRNDEKVKEYQVRLDGLSAFKTPKVQAALKHHLLSPPKDQNQTVSEVPAQSTVVACLK